MESLRLKNFILNGFNNYKKPSEEVGLIGTSKNMIVTKIKYSQVKTCENFLHKFSIKKTMNMKLITELS